MFVFLTCSVYNADNFLLNFITFNNKPDLNLVRYILDENTVMNILQIIQNGFNIIIFYCYMDTVMFLVLNAFYLKENIII